MSVINVGKDNEKSGFMSDKKTVPGLLINSPYDARADPKPVVKAEIIMLPAAASDRFGDKTNAYIWSTPAGIASANISESLVNIICRRCDNTTRRGEAC